MNVCSRHMAPDQGIIKTVDLELCIEVGRNLCEKVSSRRHMSHTYGEVLASSYDDIFACSNSNGAASAILDIGSGYGGILFAAVQRQEFLAFGIGGNSPLPPPPPTLRYLSTSFSVAADAII